MILFDAQYLKTPPDGISRFTESMLEVFINNNFLPFLLLPKSGDLGNKYKDIFPYKIAPYSMNQHPKWDLWFNFSLPKLLEKENIKIFHSPFFFTPVKMKGKIIIQVYDLAFIRYARTFPLKFVLYLKYYFKKAIKKADIILTFSEHIKQELKFLYPETKEKIVVLKPGLNEFFKKIDREKAKNYIKNKFKIDREFFLFVGTIEPRKNILPLLHLYSFEFKEDSPDFIIVGKIGWCVKKGSLKFKSSKIKFIDNATDEDLLYLYNSAKALIYPSMYEGIGLPVLEALSCQCPVITSKYTACEEHISTDLFLADPKNLRNFISQMKILIYEINQNELNEILKNELIRLKKNYSWQNLFNNIKEIYKVL